MWANVAKGIKKVAKEIVGQSWYKISKNKKIWQLPEEIKVNI